MIRRTTNDEKKRKISRMERERKKEFLLQEWTRKVKLNKERKGRIRENKVKWKRKDLVIKLYKQTKLWVNYKIM